MTYFNLRKHDGQSEIELDEDPTEDAEDETAEEPAERTYGPIITGLRGPGRWLTARFNLDTSIVVHGASLFSVLYYGGWIAAGVITVWIFLVLLFIPREALECWTAAIERFFTKRHRPAAASSLEGDRAAVQRLLLDLMGEADKVHLNTVLAHLNEKGQWEGRTVTDMRARLTLLGIPHDRNVKVAGVPTWGVRRAALEAPSPLPEGAPSPTPSPPV